MHGKGVSMGDGGYAMNILIDADGCPVVDLTLQIAKQVGIPVIICVTPRTRSSVMVRRRWCLTKGPTVWTLRWSTG